MQKLSPIVMNRADFRVSAYRIADLERIRIALPIARWGVKSIFVLSGLCWKGQTEGGITVITSKRSEAYAP